jgi:hypothetical protein
MLSHFKVPLSQLKEDIIAFNETLFEDVEQAQTFEKLLPTDEEVGGSSHCALSRSKLTDSCSFI